MHDLKAAAPQKRRSSRLNHHIAAEDADRLITVAGMVLPQCIALQAHYPYDTAHGLRHMQAVAQSLSAHGTPCRERYDRQETSPLARTCPGALRASTRLAASLLPRRAACPAAAQTPARKPMLSCRQGVHGCARPPGKPAGHACLSWPCTMLRASKAMPATRS